MTSRIELLHQLSQHLHQASLIVQSLDVPVLILIFNMAKLEILNQIKQEYIRPNAPVNDTKQNLNG